MGDKSRVRGYADEILDEMRDTICRKIYYGIFGAMIIGIWLYSCNRVISFSYFPDEFGYWATAARMSGWDWSQVASLGYYYSYGYSLILAPILMIGKDAEWSYHVAMLINALCSIASLPILDSLIRRLVPKQDVLQRCFSVGVAIFYPAWIFYNQTSLTESILTFLFTLTTYEIVRFADRPSLVRGAGLALLMCYQYTIHMRMAGVWLVGAIVLIINVIRNRKSLAGFIAFVSISAAGGVATIFLKKLVTSQVLSNMTVGRLQTNMMSSQWEKISRIFSATGLLHLLEGMLGKTFYMTCASTGLAVWAVIWALREIKTANGQNKGENGFSGDNLCIALFVLLSIASELMIASIYYINTTSVDKLMYGRYTELMIPVCICLGIGEIHRRTSQLNGAQMLRYFLVTGGLITAIAGATGLYLCSIVSRRSYSSFRGYMMVTLSGLMDLNENVGAFILRAVVTLAIGMILMCVMVAFFRLEYAFLMVSVIIVEILAGLGANEHYTYYYNTPHFSDRALVDIIDSHPNADVIFINDGSLPYIDVMQMYLGDRVINVLNDSETLQSDGFVIAYKWSDQVGKLQELYDNCYKSDTYCLFY